MKTVNCCMPGLIAGEWTERRDWDKNFSDFFSTGGIAGEHHLI